MTTTKSTIVNGVMSEMGYSATTDTKTLALMSGWFDDVFSLVLESYEWPYRTAIRELAVTASSYSDSSFDADVHQVRVMRHKATRNIIEPATVEEMFDSGVDLTLTGEPRRWYPTEWDQTNGKQKFKLWPIPSEDFTLEYHADLEPPSALADDDIIPMPPSYINVIKSGLRARALDNDEQGERALLHEQKFYQALEDLENRASMRPEDGHVMEIDGDLRALYGTRYKNRVPDRIPYNES